MTERTLEALSDEEWEMIEIIRENKDDDGFRLLIERKDGQHQRYMIGFNIGHAHVAREWLSRNNH